MGSPPENYNARAARGAIARVVPASTTSAKGTGRSVRASADTARAPEAQQRRPAVAAVAAVAVAAGLIDDAPGCSPTHRNQW